ncbi:MAG: zinc metallochaperone AztD [Ornithinimicrobium sp.]
MTSSPRSFPTRSAAVSVAACLTLALSSCADSGSGQEESSPSKAADTTTPTADPARETVEAQGPSPRLGITYDGGVLVVDAMTLETVGDFPAEGFTRLNAAGDGRHLLLTQGAAFQVLDAGVWSKPHGDHDHSYATDPELTDVTVEAQEPGHVVTHAGKTVLFADGTGEITTFDSDSLTGEELPDLEQMQTPQAHHGVAVELEDGSLLHTIGNEDERSGAVVLDSEGEEVARSEDCPGVHGETVAADEIVVLGCEDGVLTYDDGEFTKIQAADDYARIGNLAGSEASPVVLGDYKTEEDAELERPTTISLVDTRSQEITLVDLPASYTFRSLGRDAEGDALVLGTDGVLRTIEASTGEIAEETTVVQAWEEPLDWQEPRPLLHVMGDLAYVTEPATNEVHIVDLSTDEVIDSVTLSQTPNELSSVTG